MQSKREHQLAVVAAAKENKRNGARGRLAVGRLPHFRSPTGQSKCWPVKEGFININVCSSARGTWKQLSPMVLGPIDAGDGVVAANLENLWQFSKVWPDEVENAGGAAATSITAEFFKRQANGFADPIPHRRAKKVAKGTVPLFSYWKGRRLSYFEARKEIYCPLYAKYVVQTVAFVELQNMLDDGINVQLLGYDGYDFSGTTLAQCFNDITKPFGHELVLACLLLGEYAWAAPSAVCPENAC